MNKPGRNDCCWCGSRRKYKKCHSIFDDKLQKFANDGYIVPSHNIIKTPEQIEGIRESSRINIAALDCVAEKITAGVSTGEINRWVHDTTVTMGGRPAPLNYNGFPKSTCTSVNDQVCHGIPAQEIILKDGDIINVDVSTEYNGYYSDSSRMFCIGNVSDKARKLVDITKECMETGIREVQPWRCLGDMGEAVHTLALAHGYSIVREIGGHGIGLEFHEDPWVSYVSKKGTGMLMVPGMVFTIEPMVNMGSDEVYVDKDDNWTVYTADRSLSAQWEVTVLVTETGCEILTY